ncbi:MAG TPA: hypothetical protein VNM48_21195 [Chloroflexota bacterium]|nr:hypothetical protein [Chloroflexota bacterium]
MSRIRHISILRFRGIAHLEWVPRPGLNAILGAGDVGKSTIAALIEQLPRQIHAHEQGLTFGELFATTCNTSPADSSKYKEALGRLIDLKEIDAFSPEGKRRLMASTLNDADRLTPSRQPKLFAGN